MVWDVLRVYHLWLEIKAGDIDPIDLVSWNRFAPLRSVWTGKLYFLIKKL